MMLALLWLTISTPFAYACHQNLVKQGKIAKLPPDAGNEDDATNPFGNNTEKGPSDSSPFSEEYLHPANKIEYFLPREVKFYKCENSGIYTAFHGEIHVPPPNAA